MPPMVKQPAVVVRKTNTVKREEGKGLFVADRAPDDRWYGKKPDPNKPPASNLPEPAPLIPTFGTPGWRVTPSNSIMDAAYRKAYPSSK